MAAAIRLSQQHSCSFNHLVGAHKQSGWHSKAQRLGGLEVDHQFVFGRRLDWKLARFFALENAFNSTVQVFDMRGALLGSEPVRPGDDILSVARRSLRKGATPSFYRPISYPPSGVH